MSSACPWTPLPGDDTERQASYRSDEFLQSMKTRRGRTICSSRELLFRASSFWALKTPCAKARCCLVRTLASFSGRFRKREWWSWKTKAGSLGIINFTLACVLEPGDAEALLTSILFLEVAPLPEKRSTGASISKSNFMLSGSKKGYFFSCQTSPLPFLGFYARDFGFDSRRLFVFDEAE